MLSTADEVHAVKAIEATCGDIALGASLQLAGDWQGYIARFNEAATVDDLNARLSLRRQLALAYLGRRAQSAGGVYNSTSPTVLSSAVVERISAENRQRRQSRYPWLADLLAITEALERDQHVNGNVRASVIALAARRAP